MRLGSVGTIFPDFSVRNRRSVLFKRQKLEIDTKSGQVSIQTPSRPGVTDLSATPTALITPEPSIPRRQDSCARGGRDQTRGCRVDRDHGSRSSAAAALPEWRHVVKPTDRDVVIGHSVVHPKDTAPE